MRGSTRSCSGRQTPTRGCDARGSRARGSEGTEGREQVAGVEWVWEGAGLARQAKRQGTASAVEAKGTAYITCFCVAATLSVMVRPPGPRHGRQPCDRTTCRLA